MECQYYFWINVDVISFTSVFFAPFIFLDSCIVKQMIDIRNFMQLCVLNLSRIDLATAEDKHYQIDYWASLFKSTTWEEIKMLAKDNNYISDAASTVYRLSQEEMIRLQCEAREDYYRT